MESEKIHMPDAVLNNAQRARWGRRGLIGSLFIGMSVFAVKSFSWLHLSPDGREY